jgi:hypothetical protein
MTANRPSLRQPVSVRPAPREASARDRKPVASAATTPKSWHRERRRGAIAAVTVAFLMGGLLSGYGIHSQIAHAALRAEARDMQLALATAAALKNGPVLFVPEYGNACRRRWIDNASWTLRDGGEIDCDEQVSWNSTVPVRQHKVEQRLDAISKVFQSRGSGKPD